MAFKEGKIDIVSMGCSKNLVDSERLIRRLESKGYQVTHDAEQLDGEYIVVNTCGFIGDAKEESINMILDIARLKKEKSVGKLIVMGCLSERYRQELEKAIPEVDKWYGKFDWNAFSELLPSRNSDKQLKEDSTNQPKEWERTLTTPPWSAFVKISEGCNRICAFCAIPNITGRHTSRPIEEILDEVRDLVSKGVKEFNIIAQDLSSYGLDIYGAQKLPELIDRMAKIEGVEWIRLHYLYPSDFPMGILKVMRENKNVCKYLDLPLQHISDRVLQNMNRKITGEETRKLISKIREEIPDIHLRTTMMVGFPGEDDDDYEELLEFMEEMPFERLGAFAYSEEEDTPAAKNFKDYISEEEKKERLDSLMDLQEQLSFDLNLQKKGQVLKVLVERREGLNAIGRTEFDSPEVDQEVTVVNSNARPGEFIDVKIMEVLPFELLGLEVKNNHS